MLIQSYPAIPENLRRQAKLIVVWYTKEMTDLKIIRGENNVLTDDKIVIVRGLLKSQNMHVYAYKINTPWN